jgi:aminoglycoside phosphotransferase (APT) family kinase protein
MSVRDIIEEAPDREVVRALERLRLLRPGIDVRFTRLEGGVSSDIWRIDTGARRFCVKRALAKLKVAQDWRAPVERSRHEYNWICTARQVVPSAAPEPLGYDEKAGLIVLCYYDPADVRLWKEELRAGRVDIAFARAVGTSIGRIHAGTAGDPRVADLFRTDAIFHAIRLEPYLLATASRHPDLAARLQELADMTAGTKKALVHGDVSPKNILVRSDGPLFLDAECAWYGDPAFDLGFCLNHLLLKCLWTPGARESFLAAFDELASAYLAEVTWERAGDLERRVAHLLPGLFLARVDGKSPVEYLTCEADKDRVRRVARRFLAEPVDRLAPIRTAWAKELGASPVPARPRAGPEGKRGVG